MDRDLLYFGLMAAGGLVLWAVYRRSRSTGGRMAVIALLIAVAVAYAILFKVLGA